MRVSQPILICALGVFATQLTSSRSIDTRRDGLSISGFQMAAQLREGFASDVPDEARRAHGQPELSTSSGEYAFQSDRWERDVLVLDTEELRSIDNTVRETEPNAEEESDEQDFASNPTPINEGRRRAGILGILTVIALTSVLAYNAYTRRERLREIVSTLPEYLPTFRLSTLNLRHITLPTLTLPTFSTLSAPQRTRRRRLRRAKAGFRPHVSRLRAWADAERGLLNDYDYEYDGDYERERGHAHSGSSSSSLDLQEAESFDLGADEDFMIGAPRAAALSTPIPIRGSGKFRKGVGRVWGRWKRAGGKAASKKMRRGGSASGSASGSATVLFSVADDMDDLDLELETDEALPLAPTPHRYASGLGVGMGGVKGYGSAG